jgi:hypothetical protein
VVIHGRGGMNRGDGVALPSAVGRTTSVFQPPTATTVQRCYNKQRNDRKRKICHPTLCACQMAEQSINVHNPDQPQSRETDNKGPTQTKTRVPGRATRRVDSTPWRRADVGPGETAVQTTIGGRRAKLREISRGRSRIFGANEGRGGEGKGAPRNSTGRTKATRKQTGSTGSGLRDEALRRKGWR